MDGLIYSQESLIGYNMYAYCGNEPVGGYDPTGYEDLCEDDGDDENPLNDLGVTRGSHGATAGGKVTGGGGTVTKAFKSKNIKTGSYTAVKSTNMRLKFVRTGQNHHVISNTIDNAKKMNPNLDGIKRVDPRLQVRALTPQAHTGYQDWHRTYDKEMSEWLYRNQSATPQEFFNRLNEYYYGKLFNRFGPVHFGIKE